MPYAPYRLNESILNHMYSSWMNAYLIPKETIRQNEQAHTYIVPRAWGDIDDTSNIF